MSKKIVAVSEITLKDCKCFHFVKVPHVCWDTKKIHLVVEPKHYKDAEELIVSIINHEVLHLVLGKIEDEETCTRLDNFQPRYTKSLDGTLIDIRRIKKRKLNKNEKNR